MRLLFSLFLILTSINVFAQFEPQDTTYFVRSYYGIWEATDIEDADAYALTDSPFKLRYTGKIDVFFLNDKPAGHYHYEAGKPNGAFVNLFENGQVQFTGRLEKYKLVDTVQTYYRNGQLKVETDHRLITSQGKSKREEFIINFWDSLGTQTVQNGEGYRTDYYGNMEKSFEGGYKDGIKTGKWTGYNDNGSIYYQEEYEDGGKLLQGTSFDKEGNQYNYEVLNERGAFPGGSAGWARFLQENIEYPKGALEAGIEGRVEINFILDKDGNVTSPEIKRYLCTECDAEALRVIKLSPKWTPYKRRGQNARVRMMLPIVFRLE